MEESILNTIKNKLGLESDDTAFDTDIITLINTALGILYQLGVGTEPFRITDSTTTWDEYIDDSQNLDMVKDYIYMKTRLIFESATLSSNTTTVLKEQLSELEFRINIEFEETYNANNI